MAGSGEGARQLKAELSKWRGLRRRYPEEIKGRAVAWARKRRASGASYDILAADLGISVMTVWEWLKAPAGKQRPKRRKKPALLPVQIVPEEGPSPTTGSVPTKRIRREKFGGPGWTRTNDQRIMRPTAEEDEEEPSE